MAIPLMLLTLLGQARVIQCRFFLSSFKFPLSYLKVKVLE